MNAKARALGMTTAHFVDPTGLSSDNVASPADLSKLVIAASQNPTIQRTRPTAATWCGSAGAWSNSTTPIRWSRARAWNIVVQKTGYIAEAGKCLVMKAIIEGRAIVIVLLDSFGAQSRVADARRIKKWMESRFGLESARLASRKALSGARAAPSHSPLRSSRLRRDDRLPVEERVPEHALIAAIQVAVQRIEIERHDVAAGPPACRGWPGGRSDSLRPRPGR